MGEHLVIPDYRGPNVANLVPALVGPQGVAAAPVWVPDVVRNAEQIVLLVLDGLGWQQLRQHAHLVPTLDAMAGGPIDTVAPTTTATALTSITTGLTPGEHGVVGYRIDVHGDVLNVLRWTTAAGDARRRIPPDEFQPIRPFLGNNVPVVSKAEFSGTGFTAAHLAGARHVGYRMPSTLVVEVGRLLASGERFVYAYYDGVDKVAHEYGLGDHYRAELAAVDRMIGDILDGLPSGAALAITADHGQVDCPDTLLPAPEVLELSALQSGEGRFRWLHARPGAVADLLAAATGAHADIAWVVSQEQVRDEAWLGPRLSAAAASRLGDVALVARDAVSFVDPADTGPFALVARHGSLTAAEVQVPLLAAGR